MEITGEEQKVGFSKYYYVATTQDNDTTTIKHIKRSTLPAFLCCGAREEKTLATRHVPTKYFQKISSPETRSFQQIVDRLLEIQSAEQKIKQQRDEAAMLASHKIREAATKLAVYSDSCQEFLETSFLDAFKQAKAAADHHLKKMSQIDWSQAIDLEDLTQWTRDFDYSEGLFTLEFSFLEEAYQKLLWDTYQHYGAFLSEDTGASWLAFKQLSLENKRQVVQMAKEKFLASKIKEPAIVEPPVQVEPVIILQPIDPVSPSLPPSSPQVVSSSLEVIYTQCRNYLTALAKIIDNPDLKKTMEEMLPGWFLEGSNPTIGEILALFDVLSVDHATAKEGAMVIREAIAATEGTWKALNEMCDPGHMVGLSEHPLFHAFPLESLRHLLKAHLGEIPTDWTSLFRQMPLMTLRQLKAPWQRQVEHIVSLTKTHPSMFEKTTQFFTYLEDLQKEQAQWTIQEPYQFDKDYLLPLDIAKTLEKWQQVKEKSLEQAEAYIDKSMSDFKGVYGNTPKSLFTQLQALPFDAPKREQLAALVLKEKAAQIDLIQTQLTNASISAKHRTSINKQLLELVKSRECIGVNGENHHQVQDPVKLVRLLNQKMEAVFQMVTKDLKEQMLLRWVPYSRSIKQLARTPSSKRKAIWNQNLENVLQEAKETGRFDLCLEKMLHAYKATEPAIYLKTRIANSSKIADRLLETLQDVHKQHWQPSIKQAFQEIIEEFKTEIGTCTTLEDYKEWYSRYEALEELLLELGASDTDSARILAELIKSYPKKLLGITSMSGQEDVEKGKLYLQSLKKGIWPFESSTVQTMDDVHSVNSVLQGISTWRSYGVWYQKILHAFQTDLPAMLDQLIVQCQEVSLSCAHLYVEKEKLAVMNTEQLLRLSQTIQEAQESIARIHEFRKRRDDYAIVLKKARDKLGGLEGQKFEDLNNLILELEIACLKNQLITWTVSFIKSSAYARMIEFYQSAIERLEEKLGVKK